VDHFKIKKQISTGKDIFMSLSADGGLMIKDNGGTRSGKDRRKLSIINRNPERRIIEDRRSGRDRRRELKCRDCFAIERRDAFRSIHKIVNCL
jgi:hypothetical protein